MSLPIPSVPKPKFEYPYDLDFNDITKAYQLNAKVDVREINVIKGIRLRQNTLTVVTAHLFHKLINELQRKGITDFSRLEEFEQFVCTSKLVDAGEYEQLLEDSAELGRIRSARPSECDAGRGLPDRTAGGTLPQSSTPHVGKRTSGVRSKHKKHVAELSDLQSDSGKSGE